MILKNDNLEVRVKEEGAELTSIIYKGKQYLWHGKDFWKRQSPVLFPIVGRLKNDTTIIENKEYHMKQHGFARNMTFEEVYSNENKVTYLLKNNEETEAVYPYKFELYISYELTENSIIVKYEIKNVDNKNIMFCIGGHPAFNWPLVGGETFEDYYIEFEKNETQKYREVVGGCMKNTEELILNNTNRINLNKEIFKIDTFVLKDLNSKWVALKSNKNNHFVKVHFDGFPYLGIWSRTDEAPFICLEPWVGVADYVDDSGIFKEKDCVVELKEGENYECKYEIELN